MRTCEQCSIEFQPTKGARGRFCSSTCYHTFSRTISVCPQCKVEFYNKRRSVHCSRSCSNKARSGIRYDGTRSKCRVSKRAKQREFISNRDGNLCSLCGTGVVWNNVPLTLQVDHIDGNNKNDDWDNLRLLCPNCHSQTETFGGRNIRKGIEV